MKRLAWALLVFVSACGGRADDRTVGDEVADDYTDALDEAAAVEDKLKDAKADIDAAVDDGAERDDD